MTSVIDEYKWEDLSPCDFDLFPELKKKTLRGIRFEDLDELNVAVAREVRRIFSGCLATGIGDLPNRWNASDAGELLRRVLATVGLYNLLFSCTIVRTF